MPVFVCFFFLSFLYIYNFFYREWVRHGCLWNISMNGANQSMSHIFLGCYKPKKQKHVKKCVKRRVFFFNENNKNNGYKITILYHSTGAMSKRIPDLVFCSTNSTKSPMNLWITYCNFSHNLSVHTVFAIHTNYTPFPCPPRQQFIQLLRTHTNKWPHRYIQPLVSCIHNSA